MLPVDSHVFTVGLEVFVFEGPIGARTVGAVGVEVTWIEAGRIARVVHHGAADATPGVVRARRDGIIPGDHARFGPGEMVGTCLVADPVAFGVQNGPASRATAFQPARARR